MRNETTGRRHHRDCCPTPCRWAPTTRPTTLGKSVVDDGADPTRDALSTLLGTDIQGTWRLDTPYLEILVDAVGGITLDTDATVASGGKTLVTAGKGQDLNGQAAVAYATYRGPGEDAGHAARPLRAGACRRCCRRCRATPATATKIVDQMGAIPDPSLSDSQLGATLGELAGIAKTGHYTTSTLPVQPDGTLSDQATGRVVKDVLGGAVKNTDTSGIPAVAVRDATGDPKAAGAAQVAVINSGYTYVDGGKVPTRATSQVLYAGIAQAPSPPRRLAKTLGLPATRGHQGHRRRQRRHHGGLGRGL